LTNAIILQTYTTISKYWQSYTGAVDMRNRTHRHPLKHVTHQLRLIYARSHLDSAKTLIFCLYFAQFIACSPGNYYYIYYYYNIINYVMTWITYVCLFLQICGFGIFGLYTAVRRYQTVVCNSSFFSNNIFKLLFTNSNDLYYCNHHLHSFFIMLPRFCYKYLWRVIIFGSQYSCVNTGVSIQVCQYRCVITGVSIQVCQYILCQYRCVNTGVSIQVCQYRCVNVFCVNTGEFLPCSIYMDCGNSHCPVFLRDHRRHVLVCGSSGFTVQRGLLWSHLCRLLIRESALNSTR